MVKFKFTDFLYRDNYITVDEATSEWATTTESSLKKQIIRITLIQDNEEVVIELDKKTSIKFAKTLRTEINKIQ